MILKVKQWLEKNKKPQFEVLVKDGKIEFFWTKDLKLKGSKKTDGNVILSVRRIKDRFVFDLGLRYKIAGEPGEFIIKKFHEDLIHVECVVGTLQPFCVEINSIIMSDSNSFYSFS